MRAKILLCNRILGAIISANLLLACSFIGRAPEPMPYHSDYAAKRWPGTNLDSLKQYRALYIQNCSSCHFIPAVKKYSEPKWTLILHDMRERAHLSTGETEAIFHYIISVQTLDPSLPH